MDIFLGMGLDDEDDRGEDDKDKDDREQMAQNLYSKESQKVQDEQKERTELLNNLGDKFEPKYIFASNEKLRSILDEINSKNSNSTVDSKDNPDANIIEPLQASISTTPQLEELKQKYSHNIEASRNFEHQKMINNSDFVYKKKIKENLTPKELPAYNEDFYGARARNNAARDKFEKETKVWEDNIDKVKGQITRFAIDSLKGKDATAMLNLSQGEIRPIYNKDAVKLQNFNDKKISDFASGELNQFKPYMEQKIKDQFKDFGYKFEDIDGYIFKSNSAPVKRIKESADFKDMLAKNLHHIADGTSFSGRYSNDNKKSSNLYNAYGSVDFLNAGYDKNGNLKLYMFDTYEFNKNETNPAVEAGRRKMLKGDLKGYYTLHEITLTSNEIVML